MNHTKKAEHRFNPLAFAQKLKTIGVPDLQAEATAEGISQLIETDLATKYDIYEIKSEMTEIKKDIIHLDEEVKNLRKEVKETEIRLENKIKESIQESEENLTYKLTVRLGAIMVTGLTVLTILIKFL